MINTVISWLSKLKTSYKIAITISVVIFTWVLSGQFNEVKTSSYLSNRPQKATVVYKKLNATEKRMEYTFFGSTEPERKVTLKSDSDGKISSIEFREGSDIKYNDIILYIASREQANILSGAMATLKKVKKEFELGKASKGELYIAIRKLKNAENYAKRNTVRAPFTGRLEKLAVEVGATVTMGTPLGIVTDNDFVIIRSYIPQTQIDNVKLGQEATVKLIDNLNLTGKITYISHIANKQTRSFEIEISLNTKKSMAEGMTAEVTIAFDKTKAHLIPDSSLSLDVDGEVGIKLLDNDNRVVFQKIEIIDHTTDGIWVKGAGNKIKLITLGQGFVQHGDQVLAKQE
jgi:membrane fusion protein, multidrug efflux system